MDPPHLTPTPQPSMETKTSQPLTPLHYTAQSPSIAYPTQHQCQISLKVGFVPLLFLGFIKKIPEVYQNDLQNGKNLGRFQQTKSGMTCLKGQS